MINGELQEAVNQIKTELVAFRAVMEERWLNHASRADEQKIWIREMHDWLVSLPCKERSNTTEWLVWSNKLLWATVIIYGLVRGGLFLIK